jgi:hypothetical protein
MDVRRNGLLWNAFGANTNDMYQLSEEVIGTVRDLSLIYSDKMIAAFLHRNGDGQAGSKLNH